MRIIIVLLTWIAVCSGFIGTAEEFSMHSLERTVFEWCYACAFSMGGVIVLGFIVKEDA